MEKHPVLGHCFALTVTLPSLMLTGCLLQAAAPERPLPRQLRRSEFTQCAQNWNGPGQLLLQSLRRGRHSRGLQRAIWIRCPHSRHTRACDGHWGGLLPHRPLLRCDKGAFRNTPQYGPHLHSAILAHV